MTRGVARGVEEGGYAHNVGDVQRLQQVRAADAMLAAADNPGGSAMGDAMQMGMGIAMAGQMANTLGGAMQPGRDGAAAPATGSAPTPLPGQVLYHVDMGGQAGGPYSVAQIRSGIAGGQVTPATLVWTTGMASWAAASTVPELAPLFEAPPPMPPQGGDAPPPPPPASPEDGA